MTGSQQSHFSFFELLRIFIPGAYVMSLLFCMATAFNIQVGSFQTPLLSILIYFVGSMIGGLSLYSKETPKNRKAFQTNQPSTYILEKSRSTSNDRPLSDDEAKHLYFYILNNEIPTAIHDKIFFFGMVYNIIINIRRISFWFGLIGILGLIGEVAVTGSIVLSSLLFVILIWIVYFLNVRYNKADRKMQENYLDQIFWLEMHQELVETLIMKRSRLDMPKK
jgi:hypothetical protein